MGHKIPVMRAAEPAAAARLAGVPLEATVALADVAGTIKDGLLAFASASGLLVMHQMLEAELTELIGPKHARIPARAGNRHGSTSGSVVLGGRKVRAERPRGRTRDGTEIALDTWAAFASEDLLTQVVMERMLAGVATRATPTSPSRSAPSSRLARARPAARPCRGASCGPPSAPSTS